MSSTVTLSSGDSSANQASGINIDVGTSGIGEGAVLTMIAGLSTASTGGRINILSGGGSTSSSDIEIFSADSTNIGWI